MLCSLEKCPEPNCSACTLSKVRIGTMFHFTDNNLNVPAIQNHNQSVFQDQENIATVSSSGLDLEG
ncbi:hypothetical protein PM082_004550 [Marasmius tenuissimus]|nr:hypothetical protein PM082_004550 [Marasmius tenuissimus]